MRALPVVIALLIIGPAAGIGGYFAAAKFLASPLLAPCEDVLKERLRAPATYSRVSMEEADKDITVNDFELDKVGDGLDPDARYASILSEAITLGGPPPRRYQLFLTYDAANVYGTPLRAVAECDYDAPRGAIPSLDKYDVTVDGLTSLGWLKSQLAAAG